MTRKNGHSLNGTEPESCLKEGVHALAPEWAASMTSLETCMGFLTLLRNEATIVSFQSLNIGTSTVTSLRVLEMCLERSWHVEADVPLKT